MKLHHLLALVVLGCPQLRAEDKPAATSAPTEIYDPKAVDVLRGKKGQILTVEGTLAGSGENKSGTRRFLNFTNNFRDSVSLVFVVASKPEEFTMDKITAWTGKKVRVTGTISEFNGQVQMVIEKWDQVKEVQ